MKITLINAPSTLDACRVFHAMGYYGEKLLTKQLLKHIEVRVVFVKDLIKKEKVEADCCWDDDNVRPRDFIIRLDAKMGERKVLQGLAHEMVHLKQYAKGEMRDLVSSDEKLRWHKETVSLKETPYWDLPWEIEAYGRERGLYETFKVRWRKVRKDAKAAYEAKPDSAGTPHSFVLKASRGEQEEL